MGIMIDWHVQTADLASCLGSIELAQPPRRNCWPGDLPSPILYQFLAMTNSPNLGLCGLVLLLLVKSNCWALLDESIE